MKLIFAFTILFLAQSCSWLESDYDKLMNPIKAIKLAEKKAGKANPIFDGVREPDFPDEKLNNETLEGVDSNHDGVRDDIEIWINRTAEDEYIRQARKNEYREFLKMIVLFEVADSLDEEKIRNHVVKWTMAGGCLVTLYQPYNEKYLEVRKVNGSQNNDKVFQLIFSNNLHRKQIMSKFNSHQINGTIGGDSISYCKDQLFSKGFLQRLQDAIKHNIPK